MNPKYITRTHNNPVYNHPDSKEPQYISRIHRSPVYKITELIISYIITGTQSNLIYKLPERIEILYNPKYISPGLTGTVYNYRIIYNYRDS